MANNLPLDLRGLSLVLKVSWLHTTAEFHIMTKQLSSAPCFGVVRKLKWICDEYYRLIPMKC